MQPTTTLTAVIGRIAVSQAINSLQSIKLGVLERVFTQHTCFRLDRHRK